MRTFRLRVEIDGVIHHETEFGPCKTICGVRWQVPPAHDDRPIGTFHWAEISCLACIAEES